MNTSVSKALVMLLLFLPLFACGGGGGGTPTPAAVAQRAELTVGLQGSDLIGALHIAIVLPEGFILESDGDGQPTDTALFMLVDGTMEINYTPETETTNGQLIIAIINANGFASRADLLKVSRVFAAGASLPTADDFEVSIEAFDLDGVIMPAVLTTNLTIIPVS